MTTKIKKPTGYKRECRTCEFFEKDLDTLGIGECHRFPPQLELDEETDRFPYVFDDTWCGEYKEEW